jgi:hypothetical protein
VPLPRWDCPQLPRAAVGQGVVASVSDTTIWGLLSAGAIRRWQHRRWIFLRHPDFAPEAGPVLDLYERIWEGRELGGDAYSISAAGKPGLQGTGLPPPRTPSCPGRTGLVEFEAKANSVGTAGGP